MTASRSSSCGGGVAVISGADVTVTRALASAVPPGPLAVRRYVVDCWGRIERLPFACTEPISGEMLTVVAFSALHSTVVDCPRSIDVGLTVIVAVGFGVAAGAGGDAGGGGVTGAGFFLQPAASKTNITHKTNRRSLLLRMNLSSLVGAQ